MDEPPDSVFAPKDARDADGAPGHILTSADLGFVDLDLYKIPQVIASIPGHGFKAYLSLFEPGCGDLNVLRNLAPATRDTAKAASEGYVILRGEQRCDGYGIPYGKFYECLMIVFHQLVKVC
jgi:hypothetical protein